MQYRINDYWLLEFIENDNFILQTDPDLVFPGKRYMNTTHSKLDIKDLPRFLEEFIIKDQDEITTIHDFIFFKSAEECEEYMIKLGYIFTSEWMMEYNEPPGMKRFYSNGEKLKSIFYRSYRDGTFNGYTKKE